MAEVRLWSSKAEREMYENYSEIFAILTTMERLEKMYVRDVISPDVYEPACTKLIAQFRTLKNALAGSLPEIDRFAMAYKLDCPAALKRLQSGIPATVEHKSASSSESGPAAVAVAECVQHFITSMDALRLNMVAVDQLYPHLLDLMGSLNKVPQLPQDFEGKVKALEWISTLNRMGASDELSDQQARQVLFDLESSYQSFINWLPSSS